MFKVRFNKVIFFVFDVLIQQMIQISKPIGVARKV